MTAALFQDSTANALAVSMSARDITTGGNISGVYLKHTMAAGTASSTTFKIRAGNTNAGTTTFNGTLGGRLYGGTYASFLSITEYKA